MNPKLGDLTIREAGKFTGDNGLVVKFSQSNAAILCGDSKEGKTTALEVLKILCGERAGDQVIKDLVNRDSGKLDFELPFKGTDGEKYVARRTKSEYSLRKEGETKNLPEPKTKMGTLVGRAAVDPLSLKTDSVEKIIEFFASYLKDGGEKFKNKLKANKDWVKELESARATANKEAKIRIGLLITAGLMNDEGELLEAAWKERETKNATKPDIDKSEQQLKLATKNIETYRDNKTKVERQKEKKKEKEEEIRRLTEELEGINANIITGEEWLTKNEKVNQQYEAAKEYHVNVAKLKSDWDDWQASIKHKKEWDEFETAAQLADSESKEAIKEKTEMLSELIPDARGIELVLEDEPDRPAGFYVGGFNSRQQSATEFLTAIIKVLKKLGCRILIMDDSATYGSDFMKLIEQLKKDGWYILLSEMHRNEELRIEYV